MKTIVITGGSDGLGKTLTETFSKENNVIILATNEEKMNELKINYIKFSSFPAESFFLSLRMRNMPTCNNSIRKRAKL